MSTLEPKYIALISDDTSDGCGLNSVRVGWQSWCRLCAKNDPEGCENVLLKEEMLGRHVVEKIVNVIRKYFKIQITDEAKPPNVLCVECFSLVKTFLKFAKHVTKVQNMFLTLHNSCNEGSSLSDMQAIRIKYGLLEGHNKYVLEHSQLPNEHNEDITSATTIAAAAEGEEEEEEYVTDEPVLENPLEIKTENTMDYALVDGNMENSCNDDDEQTIDDDEEDIKYEYEVVTPAKDDSDTDSDSEQVSNDSVEEESKTWKRRKREKVECTENGAKKIKCPKCPREFKRLNDLGIHMRRTHRSKLPNQEWPCPHCTRVFDANYKLQRHMVIHLPNEVRNIVPCPYCEKKFSTKYLLRTHIKCVHIDERPVVCEKCGVSVRTVAALKSHMLTHTDYAPFQCDTCGKYFKNEYRLKNHKKHHDPQKYTCDECGIQVNSRVSLKNHALVHSDEMKYKCDYCERRFKRKLNLRNHLLLHTDLQPYSCNFCDRTFSNGSNCRSHKKKEHPKELAELEAAGIQIYTHDIPKLDELTIMVKAAAANAKPERQLNQLENGKFKCDECGIEVNSRNGLKKHAIVHTGEKKFKCDYCGSAFKRSTTLRNHLILHTDLRPYSCDFCDRTFANGTTCRGHKKKAHPKELAELEAAGFQTFTYNVPKLKDLKVMVKAAAEMVGDIKEQPAETELNIKEDNMDNEENSL